jgi:hypothetical protein
VNARPDDKLKALQEIAELTMERMNTGKDITANEAFVLGQISGIACREPGVIQYLKDREQQRHAAAEGRRAGEGFSRSWPPGVHGDRQED